jgi:hypothetical protein
MHALDHCVDDLHLLSSGFGRKYGTIIADADNDIGRMK